MNNFFHVHALQFVHCLFQKLQEEIVAHLGYLARLGCAQEVSRSPYLQVFHGQGEAATGLHLDDSHEPLPCILWYLRKVWYQEIGECLFMAPAHAPAQLIELGQAKVVCPVNDHGIGRWYVYPRFDDGGTDQAVDLAAYEPDHYLLKSGFFHLAVGYLDHCPWEHSSQSLCHPFYALDPVVNVEDLSPPGQFVFDGFFYNGWIELGKKGLYREAVPGRCLYQR